MTQTRTGITATEHNTNVFTLREEITQINRPDGSVVVQAIDYSCLGTLNGKLIVVSLKAGEKLRFAPSNRTGWFIKALATPAWTTAGDLDSITGKELFIERGTTLELWALCQVPIQITYQSQ